MIHSDFIIPVFSVFYFPNTGISPENHLFFAAKKNFYIISRVGDNFTSFLSTATGWGNVGLENGEPFLDVKYGEIPIELMVVSGEKIQ